LSGTFKEMQNISKNSLC